jgi:hypothetical protein
MGNSHQTSRVVNRAKLIVPDISFEILLYIIPVNLTFALETDIVNQDQLLTDQDGSRC